MKLSELKPGMRVTRKEYQDSRPHEVTAVGRFNVLLLVNEKEFSDNHQEGWIIIEPRKKPSERISEISSEFFLATPDRYAAMHHAICKYLDEQSDLKCTR